MTNIAFLQSPIQGPAGNKASDVVLGSTADFLPATVTMQTPQTGGHIFYRVTDSNTSNVGLPPQHNGDSAISPTVRIGSNSGSVFLGNNGKTFRVVTALCYQSGYTDSNVTTLAMEAPEPPGGGGG